MSEIRKIRRGSAVGRGLNRVLRFGVRRGLRSIEVKPEDFRRQLADKHGLWVPNFSRMHDVPLERLDAIAQKLIRDAERLAAAETETRRRDSRKMGGENDSGGQLGHRRTAELYICAYLGTPRAAQFAGKAPRCPRLQFDSSASLSSV